MPARPPEPAMLIALGGLPGVGKSALARSLARRIGAVHLRIDTIEQAMRNAGFTVSGRRGTSEASSLAAFAAAWKTTAAAPRRARSSRAAAIPPSRTPRRGG